MTPRPSLFEQERHDWLVFSVFDAHAPHVMRRLDLELVRAGDRAPCGLVGRIWRGVAPSRLAIGDGSHGFSGESAPTGAARAVLETLIAFTRGQE